MVPKSLKCWFTTHFIVDYIFGLPLLFIPDLVEPLLGLYNTPLVLLRLIGATLLGIGGISLVAKNSSVETYKTLLRMKIIWSISAITGLIISLVEGFSWQLVAITLLFAVFSVTWFYFLKKLNAEKA